MFDGKVGWVESRHSLLVANRSASVSQRPVHLYMQIRPPFGVGWQAIEDLQADGRTVRTRSGLDDDHEAEARVAEVDGRTVFEATKGGRGLSVGTGNPDVRDRGPGPQRGEVGSGDEGVLVGVRTEARGRLGVEQTIDELLHVRFIRFAVAVGIAKHLTLHDTRGSP